MTLVMVGLSHTSTTEAFIAQAAVSDSDAVRFLAALADEPHIKGAAVLSTCARVEVYVTAEQFDGVHEAVLRALARHAGSTVEDLADQVHMDTGVSAARHLLRVAAGLDSRILGEDEILGQVRRAQEAARRADTLHGELYSAMAAAISAGRRVRSELPRPAAGSSLAAMALDTAVRSCGRTSDLNAVVVGAGALGSAMCRVAAAHPAVRHLVVANRSFDAAEALAVKHGALPDTLEHLDVLVDWADVVLYAVSSGANLIDSTMLNRPRQHSLLLVDCSVPHSIQLEGSEQVVLFTASDIVREARSAAWDRDAWRQGAESIVAEELASHAERIRQREHAATLALLHRSVDELRRAEIERHKRLFDSLDGTQRDLVEKLTRQLVAKILHNPSVRIREAAGTPSAARVTRTAAELFGLEK